MTQPTFTKIVIIYQANYFCFFWLFQIYFVILPKYPTMQLSDNHFKCDVCNSYFLPSKDTFIGSFDDFEFIMDKGNVTEQVKDIECSPFMNYVQLCAECYKKKLRNEH